GAVLGLLVGAAAASRAPVTWADWVGDWSGKLRWAGCTTNGSATAKLAIDATDGAMAIDLAPAGAALGAFGLIENELGFSAQHADVAVVLTRKSGVELEVRFDSGCTMRASLSRPTTGIAACDRLDAWARIESKCGKLTAKPLEDPKLLAKERDGWLKARGDARAKLGEQCTARAARVALELTDAGCAPHPDPLIGVRAKDGLAPVAAAAQLARCGSAPPDLTSTISSGAAQLAGAAQTADAASLPIVERECRDAHQRVVAVAT